MDSVLGIKAVVVLPGYAVDDSGVLLKGYQKAVTAMQLLHKILRYHYGSLR